MTRPRRTALLLSLVACVGCDTLISDRMVVRTDFEGGASATSADQVLMLVHETLTAADFTALGESRGVESWAWRGSKPPGIHVTVQRVGDEVQVRLAQDLYGPIAPTDKYTHLRRTLQEAVAHRFGKASLRLE